jgi:hypothetical protein
MNTNGSNGIFIVQPLTIDTIQKNYTADLNWRLRRHPQWTLSYELYRDTVIVNRLPDATNAELAAYLQWPVNRITPRCLELRKWALSWKAEGQRAGRRAAPLTHGSLSIRCCRQRLSKKAILWEHRKLCFYNIHSVASSEALSMSNLDNSVRIAPIP